MQSFAATIRRERDLIRNTRDHALAKRAYGFHSPDALIAMTLLTRGGLCPTTTRSSSIKPDRWKCQ
jgi:transposase